MTSSLSVEEVAARVAEDATLKAEAERLKAALAAVEKRREAVEVRECSACGVKYAPNGFYVCDSCYKQVSTRIRINSSEVEGSAGCLIQAFHGRKRTVMSSNNWELGVKIYVGDERNYIEIKPREGGGFDVVPYYGVAFLWDGLDFRLKKVSPSRSSLVTPEAVEAGPGAMFGKTKDGDEVNK